MNGFLYTLTLEEPVLANSLGGEPNSAQSLFYIPGGLIRGAAINAYANKNDESANDDDTFRRLFLNGESRFLNAYPLIKEARALPIPLKYKKDKYLDVGNLGQTDVVNKKINALEEEWQVNVHTQRDARMGRSTAASGAIYRYIALPAGMKFQGAVISENAQCIKDILDKNKNILLGKARTAGYGRANITTHDLREMNEIPKSALKQFALVLLSPALVRNEDGQFTLDISTALSKRLDRVATIDMTQTFSKSEIVGGFNRTWGLPLPQSIAIAAGSVFYVHLDNEITVAEIKALEETGIGERRAEGFGELSVTTPLPDIDKDQWTAISVELCEENNNEEDLSGEDNKLAEMMLARLLRRELDELILTTTSEMIAKYEKETVPGSQLSRWKVIVRDSIAKRGTKITEDGGEKDFDPIKRMKTFYTAENKKRSSAWVKMEKARVMFGGKPNRLTEWIEATLENPADVEKILESHIKLKIGENKSQLTPALKIEYRLRLIDAVLSMMAKKNSSKGGENGR